MRLKVKPSGTGCIREIRRGRQLWRADLFNHVRHSTLSFCPFYYDILAPSLSLSVSQSRLGMWSEYVPSPCQIHAAAESVGWSLWIVTCENDVWSSREEQTRFHHEHIFGWDDGIRWVELRHNWEVKKKAAVPRVHLSVNFVSVFSLKVLSWHGNNTNFIINLVWKYEISNK